MGGQYVTVFLLLVWGHFAQAGPTDIALDAKATLNHRLDSLNLLLYMCLLTLTVVTIWVFKHRRVSWLHETGLAVIYGGYISIIRVFYVSINKSIACLSSFVQLQWGDYLDCNSHQNS